MMAPLAIRPHLEPELFQTHRRRTHTITLIMLLHQCQLRHSGRVRPSRVAAEASTLPALQRAQAVNVLHPLLGTEVHWRWCDPSVVDPVIQVIAQSILQRMVLVYIQPVEVLCGVVGVRSSTGIQTLRVMDRMEATHPILTEARDTTFNPPFTAKTIEECLQGMQVRQ